MNLCSIASGSSGNCIYVGSDHAGVLVDVGISGKKIEEGLNTIDRTTKDCDGILITHEHSDHIKGLGVISRKYKIPIYCTRGTMEEMQRMTTLGKMRRDCTGSYGQMNHFPSGIWISIPLTFPMTPQSLSGTG